MPDLRDEFEALMPEPHAIFTAKCGRRLYTADQLRAAMQAVAERAAKKERDLETAFLWCLRNLTEIGNYKIRVDPENGVIRAWEAIRARDGKGEM